MFTLSVDECDLIDFFGAEHLSPEFGTEWFDSDSLYEHQRPDGLTLTCAVHPIHKDARITLSFNGHVCYDWQATALMTSSMIANRNVFASRRRLAIYERFGSLHKSPCCMTAYFGGSSN